MGPKELPSNGPLPNHKPSTLIRVLAAVVAMYLIGWVYAARIDALSPDTESEEEAGTLSLSITHTHTA